MRQTSFADIHCSLARSLDIVGDWWSPLILRDVSLGVDTFDALVADLGVSRGLLTTRLGQLIDGGVLVRSPYSQRPERFRYELSESGRDLLPILVALTQWGDRWVAPDGPPIRFRHDCGEMLESEVRCAGCGRALVYGEYQAVPGPGGRAARGTAVIAGILAGVAP